MSAEAPAPTVRIAQLTDIHVRDWTDLRRRDFLGKRLTGWFNYRTKRHKEYSGAVLDDAVLALIDERPDLVVVTGDLSNLGLRSELVAARAVLQPIADAGIGICVIPGNHDYYVASSANGQFEEVFAPWQQADARLDGVYPFVVRRGPVSVVCFNSAIPSPPMFAVGRLGEAQMLRAHTLVAAEHAAGQQLLFAVHHHATRAPHKRVDTTRRLQDAPALRELARRYGAALIIHGHNHHLHLRRIGDAKGPMVCGISSGTVRQSHKSERHGMFAVHEFDATGLCGIRIRAWGPAGFGPWTPLDLSHVPVESLRESRT